MKRSLWFVAVAILCATVSLGQNGSSTEPASTAKGAILAKGVGSAKSAAATPKGGWLLYELFDDNRRDWYAGVSSDGILGVFNGWYLLERTGPGYNFAGKQVPEVGLNDDFVMEVSAHKLFGVNNYGYGLYWGLRDSKNFYALCVFGDGAFAILGFESGVERLLIKYTPSPEVRKLNQRNVLKVQRNRESLIFSVNGAVIGKVPATPSFGNYFGMIVYNDQAIVYDYIAVGKV